MGPGTAPCLWSTGSQSSESSTAAKYYHSVLMLDAQDFGVPQTRRRMFLVAAKDFQPPRQITATTTNRFAAADILDPIGVHEARPVLGRERPLADATIARIARGRKALRTGEDFLIVYYGSDAAGGWQPLDRPLRTLTTLDRFGLVSGTGRRATLRMLQAPELKRAMGFQDNYQLARGTRRDRIRLLGNAVCPPVMEAVVKALVKAANAHRAPALGHPGSTARPRATILV